MSKLPLLPLLQNRKSESSGTGISYYSSLHDCARQVRLMKERKLAVEDAEDDAGYGAQVGTYYHALKELALSPTLREQYALDASETDLVFNEALRLFNAYAEHWGSQCPWGTLVDVEEQGTHADVTGLTRRIDCIVDVPGGLIRGLQLEPGRYLIDWKTGKANRTQDAYEYVDGLQAMNYMDGYNLEHPDTPVIGCIFDKIVRHKVITKNSFSVYLAKPHYDAREILRNFVQQGEELKAADWANAKHCYSGWKPCPFLVDGSCPRR